MWTVVLAVVLEWYPELVQLWSISRNTAGHVQRAVSEVTGMTLIYTLWSKQIQEGKSPCYKTIVANVTKGRPWWAGMVEHFIEFLGRHSGDKDGLRWKRFQTFHAHCVESDERQMPAYMWRDLAMMLESRSVYAMLFASYTSPPWGVEQKQSTWFKVTDLRTLRAAESAKTRSEAEEFLTSVADVFEGSGSFNTWASAAAVVCTGVKGYDTLAKAQRSAGEKSKDIYIKTAVMTGRYLCKKPHDEDFGKDTADNLGDILARMR